MVLARSDSFRFYVPVSHGTNDDQRCAILGFSLVIDLLPGEMPVDSVLPLLLVSEPGQKVQEK